MKKKNVLVFLIISAILLSFSSCTEDVKETHYSEHDLRSELGINISFPKIEATASSPLDSENAEGDDSDSSDVSSFEGFRMKVSGELRIYSSPSIHNYTKTLTDGESIVIKVTDKNGWAVVYGTDGGLIGYARDTFSSTVADGGAVYAELPIEYGMARTNQGTYVPAYSNLVDVRKYFNVYSSTESLIGKADFSEYDLVVAMKLSTEETTIKEPFYNSNIAMVQYDLIPMIAKAIELFAKDGYTMVICDAYRPTSVQQRWFDVVQVHMWVADPSIGMGGVHDRGTALDITLIDKNGKELEFPTPMHTFTYESSRNSTTMTATARQNMNYMLSVMTQCGFTYIQSEWWHFQDVNTKSYLPTDHPIDGIPLVPSETSAVGSVSAN